MTRQDWLKEFKAVKDNLYSLARKIDDHTINLTNNNEKLITDLEIAQIENERYITDLEIAILEK